MSEDEIPLPGAVYQCIRGEWLLGLSGWSKAVDKKGRAWACRALPQDGMNTFEPDDYEQIEVRQREMGVANIEEVSFYSESWAALSEDLTYFGSDQ